MRGTRDARARDVADDRDLELVEAALGLADGQRVEQALGRVREVRFAGGHDRGLDIHGARDLCLHARLGVADDEHVDAHGEQRVDRVEQRLALGARREPDIEVDDMCALPDRRELERGARAGRGLAEDVRDREPRERVAAAGRLREGLGALEQRLDADCAAGRLA